MLPLDHHELKLALLNAKVEMDAEMVGPHNAGFIQAHKFHQEKVEVLHMETVSILQQVLNLLLLLFQAEKPFLQDHDQEEDNWEAVVHNCCLLLQAC